mgnify:CR=1 FL=1
MTIPGGGDPGWGQASVIHYEWKLVSPWSDARDSFMQTDVGRASHLLEKNTKISIVFEDLSRNSVFFQPETLDMCLDLEEGLGGGVELAFWKDLD